MLPAKVFGVLWLVMTGGALYAAHDAPLASAIALLVLIYVLFLEVRYTELLARDGAHELARIRGGERLAELRRKEIAAVVYAVSLSGDSRKAYADFLARGHSLLAGEQERSDLH
jgi:hypothetical protein